MPNNAIHMNPLIYALAGLLHDIGKFGQRADEPNYEKSTYLSPIAKRLIGQICKPTESGWYSHQHVLWTYELLEQNRKKFVNAGLSTESENLVNLASYHHVPNKDKDRIITLADWCSSGLDRNSDAYLKKNSEPEKKFNYRDIPIVSIFQSLHAGDSKYEDGNPTTYAYPVLKFSLDDKIFPVDKNQINDNFHRYRQLWEEFVKDFNDLPDYHKPQPFIETVFHLLKLYTWYMPASSIDFPNPVSLFEHCKVTGAFAHCIAAYWNQHPDAFQVYENYKLHLQNGHYPFKLWACNVSGIQKFIYNISNKSAAKSLKGRSLYIQLLLETIAREMLEEVGASIVNVIYIAGGKFYLLLPNTDEVNQKIELYYTKLQEKIWEEHKEHIAVYIGGIAFRMDMKDNKENEDNKAYIQIEGENEHRSVGDLWGLLEQRLGSERQSRLKRRLVEDENFYNQLFQAHGEGGDVKVCAVTGLEVEEKEENLLNKDDVEQGDEEEKVYVSQQVKEQIRLGKSLMNHRYLIRLKSQERDAFQMGVSSYWKFMDKLPANLDNVKTILCTNQPEFLQEIMNAVQNKNQIKDIGLGFRLYGGAEFPQINGKIKTFEELAREDNVSNQQEENQKEKVFTRLGILRMDVDNLGNLFKYGFEKKLSSFSALATLSTELDLFFSGYLNTLRNQNEYRDHVIVIYSGGDDVFAVGRWNKIIAFASQIRKDFRKFVCQREEISLSCGIALVRPKFPISKAADIAGEAEDAAKKYDSQINNQTFKKNAINFLGLSLNWFHEWPFVEDCKEDLVYWIQKGILSKGILMKIFQWYDQYQFYANRQTSQARQPANSQPLRWKWHAAYSFARIAASVGYGDKKQEVQQACDELKKLLFCGQYQPLTSKNNAGKPYHHIDFHALVVACRWAELILRNL